MKGYFCPVEGCEFGRHEEKTQSQVTRHINAKTGEDHADVDRLRKQVEEQGEEDDEGNEDSDDGEPEDEPDDEPPADTESDPEEESEDMANTDEYRQQYQQQGNEQSGDSDQSTGNDDGSENESGGFLGSLTPSRLSTTTIVLMVGVTLVILYLYVRFSDDDGGEGDAVETTEPQLQEDQTSDPDDGGFQPVTPAQEGA